MRTTASESPFQPPCAHRESVKELRANTEHQTAHLMARLAAEMAAFKARSTRENVAATTVEEDGGHDRCEVGANMLA